jgi:signal transduction histidine kinase
MRTVDGLAVDYALPDRNRVEPRTSLFDRLEQNKLLVLAIAVAIGFCARAYRLDAAGFAEDESNKIFALRAYEQRVTNVAVIDALASGLPQLFADPHQLQQVLLNLIINAEHAIADVPVTIHIGCPLRRSRHNRRSE